MFHAGRFFFAAVTVLGISAVLCRSGQAQTAYTWTNADGTGVWNDTSGTGTWNPATGYPGFSSSADSAFFPATVSGTTTLTAPVTVGSIVFSNTGANMQLAGTGANVLNLDNGGAITLAKNIISGNASNFNETISAPLNLLGSGTLASYNGTFANNQNTGKLLFSGSLSGAGALTIVTTATGMIQLTGGANDNGFTGTISVVGPAVTAPSKAFAGLYGSAGSFAKATALNFTNASWQSPGNIGAAIPITINAGGTAFTAYGGYTQNANMTVNSGGTLDLDSGGGNDSTYSDVLAGPGSLLFTGDPTIAHGADATLSGGTANTLSGQTIVENGELVLNKTAGINAIGAGAGVTVGFSGKAVLLWNQNNQINDATVVTVFSSSTSTTTFGQLWLQGHSDTIAGLVSTGSNTGFVLNQSATTSGVLTIAPSAGASYTYGAQIANGTTTGQGTLSIGIAGPGQQIFNGACTYSGTTTISGGMLTLGSSGSMAHATINVSGGTMNGSGTIAFNPNEEIIVGAAGTFDASGGMQWNLGSLSAGTVSLLDFTSGGTFVSPATLDNLLTPASAIKYSLSDVASGAGGIIEAIALSTNTWNVDASGNWVSTPSNWVGNVVPNSAGTPANFGSVITAPRTVTVDSPVTVGSLSFNNSNSYTLLDTTGTNTITFNNLSSDASIGVNLGSHFIAAPVILGGNGVVDITVNPSSGTLTISGNISEASFGSGVLNTAAASTGTVLLTGTNSFTGGVTVNGGTLIAGGGSALSRNIAVAVKNSAAFGLNAATDNQTIGSLNVESATAIIQPNGGTLTVAANGNNSIQGLTGPGTVTLTPSASNVTQTFGSNSAFTGNLTINGGNIATTGAAGSAFGAPGTVTTLYNIVSWGGFPGTAASQSLHITGSTTNVETAGGSGIYSGNLSIDSSATFYYNTGGGNPGNFTGVISGSGNIVDQGGPENSFEFSALTLSGTAANTLSGNFILQQGSLALDKTAGVNAIAGPVTVGIGASNAHLILEANQQINPSVVVTMGNLGDFRLSGFSETIGGLASTASQGFVANYGAGASTLTINTLGNNTYSGALIDGGSGALTLVVGGSGLQLLSGSSSYSGGTFVQAGTLQLGNTAALGSGALAANGGTLDLNGTAVVAPSFSGASGVVTDSSAAAGVTPFSVNQSTSTTFGGSFQTGPNGQRIGLYLSGGGSLTLNGASTLSSANVNNVSTLVINGSVTADAINVNYPTPGGAQLAGTGTIALTTNGAGITYSSSAASTFAGTIAGSPIDGGVNVYGGSLTLGGSNSYQGGTYVFGGVLAAANSAALGSGGAFVYGGTLDASQTALTISSLSLTSSATLNLSVGNLLTSTGAAGFAGGLNVTGDTGAAILMTYSSESGTFDPGLVTGIYPGFQLSYGATQLDIVAALSGPSTWQYATSGSWNDPSKWSGPVPNGSGAQAVVGAATTASYTITLDGPQTLGTLTFTNTASSTAGYTLAAGSAGSLTMNNSGSDAQIIVASGAHGISAPVEIAGGNLDITESNGSTLMISGNIADDNGSRTLTLGGDGTGTLTLAGTNTFGANGGGTIVAAGTLVLDDSEALASGSSLTVGDASAFGSVIAANGAAIAAVPEPGTVALFIAGLVTGFGVWQRKKRIARDRDGLQLTAP